MKKSYAEWDKFDVDAELERAQTLEEREEREKQRKLIYKEQEQFERKISQQTKLSAEALTSQAAVAALKSKKNKLKSNKLIKEEDEENTNKIQQLQTKALLIQQKSQYFEEILTLRNQGKEMLTKKLYEEAYVYFKNGLNKAQDFKELIPKLLEDENHDNFSHNSKTNPNPKPNQTSSPSSSCCSNHKEGKDHTCEEEENTLKYVPKLPNQTDLNGMNQMFQHDCLLGMGKAKYGLKEYAIASEQFKTILLENRMNLDAWIDRGKCFDQMKAPLVSYLHFNQVVSMDKTHDDAQDCLDSAKSIIVSLDEYTEEELISKEIHSMEKLRSWKERMKQLIELRKQGDVLMLEGMYTTAIRKYQAIIRMIKQWKEQFPQWNLPIVLKKIESACHMSISGCIIEGKLSYSKALNHMNQFLSIYENYIPSYVARGLTYQKLLQFDVACKDFKQAYSLCMKDNEEIKEIVMKHIEKCEYDRKHMDIKYIQTLKKQQRSV